MEGVAECARHPVQWTRRWYTNHHTGTARMEKGLSCFVVRTTVKTVRVAPTLDTLPTCDCEWEYGECDSLLGSPVGKGNHFCQPIITQQPQHAGRELP
ncbi:hypothetical protein GBAR_LOCUS29558 [Geodia barretti]|uniref:Uncharacterized protein n=1 Tax=Geodia barretti TaxID=519541 RepID=A0AA35TW09_GEOBA|nr:hypothetical protein GBAR_LOCUS29558 [Geodia barretti]